MTKSYDAIIIGTGQSGPPLAGRLSAEGLKTAVIERKQFGGTCVSPPRHWSVVRGSHNWHGVLTNSVW